MLAKVKGSKGHLGWIIAESGCAWVPDAIIAPVNMKAMEMAVVPAKCLLYDRVESSQMGGCWHEHAPPDHRADTAQPDAELVDSLGCVRGTGHHRALRVRVLGIGLS